MINLKIVLDEGWVREKASQGVRVMRQLERWISSSGVARMKASSTNAVVVEMDQARRPEFEKALVEKIKGDFKANDLSKIVSYEELSADADKPSRNASSSAAGTEPAARQKAATTADEAKPAEARPAEEPSGKPAGKSGKLEKLLDGVPFRYSRELAAFMRETDMVIPMLARMDAMNSFWNRSLLVAMDDGCGLTDFLKALGRLYGMHGIAKADLGPRDIREMRIEPSAHDEESVDGWDRAVDVAKDMKRANEGNAGSRPVLCLDIGAWQGRLGRGAVKGVLRKLKANSDNFTLVFRIPFVEASSMNAVSEALSDVFSLRPIVVPPTSLDNLADYVRDSLSKRSFSLADDAHDALERIILDEKRDDSFFGFKTMDKIVDNIIYSKAMANCRNGAVDRDIARDDLVPGATSLKPPDGDPRRELESLVGLASVKEKVSEIVAQIKAQRRLASKGRKVKRPAIHMLFTGNPGTGKTTVARIVARLLKEEGVLRKGHLIEVKGRDLCGEYVGQTAPRTSAICRDAYGSVLFIDEAYSLFRGDGSDVDYGREALDTLIAEMENHRDDMCVIMAGYTDEMETMLRGNAGMRSRIPYSIDFPNYTKEELGDIFFSMLGENFEYEKPLEKAVRKFFGGLSDEAISGKGFSNARFVRNLYERTWGKAAYRSRLDDGEIRILASDLAGAAEEKEFRQLLEKTARRPIGFGAWAD